MGGIKSKLTKQLSNKTIPLSDYRLTSPFSQRGTKNTTNKGFLSLKGAQDLLWDQRRQMKSGRISIGGFDRLVRITKYTSLACLTLAILSTLVLNIISSYSYSKVNSNAEPVSNANTSDTSTLSNVGPTSISISISSYPSATGDTNDGNLSLSIPRGGGLVAGRHTVGINPGSEISTYSVKLTTGDENGNTDLVNQDGSTSSNNYSIKSLPYNNLNTPSMVIPLQNNTWGVAIPSLNTDNYPVVIYDDESAYENLINNPLTGTSTEIDSNAGKYRFTGLPSVTSSGVNTIYSYNLPSLPGSTSPLPKHDISVYYGVRVDHPESTPAGNYTAQVVYSVTAKLQEPVLTNIEPSTYELGSNESNTITITGKYLSTASKVYLTNTDTSAGNSGTQYDCTNLQLLSNDASGNTTLTCNIPTDTTNPAIEDPGTYSLTIETEGGTTTKEDAITYTKPSICRNNDPDSDCQVDIDDNMIPIAYDGYDGNGGGNWRIVTKEEIENNKGSWYDYGSKQWANAITLRDDYEGGCYFFRKDLLPERAVLWTSGDYCYDNETIQHYTPLELAKMIRDEPDTFMSLDNANSTLLNMDVSDGTSATEVILGYWVYIPRYAYEVQRRDAIDRVVDPQNFDIVFQTADEKNTPAPTCNSVDSVWVNGAPTADAGSDSANILSKDYRTGCWPNNRTYIANSSNTTWATHPAFTWQYTTETNGFDKTYELNGIWVGKFETTGKRTAPTVKPNQHANISERVGRFYSMARSIGYPDSNNIGGGSSDLDDPTDDLVQNSHHLSTATSHLFKNSEWGATVYLAHSKYGAGINKNYLRKSNVSKNGAYLARGSRDADGDSSAYSPTGCGPSNAGSAGSYIVNTILDEDTIESDLACGSAAKSYNGSDGVHASTTNNVYGIYDMAGGVDEDLAGNVTASDIQSTSWSAAYMKEQAKSPYVDLYKTSNGFGAKPSWSSGSSESNYNYDVCTFETCGGTATYETTIVQSNRGYDSWGDITSLFASSGGWFQRGEHSLESYASLFDSHYVTGNGYASDEGSRAALLVMP